MVDSLCFKIVWLSNLKRDAEREFLKLPAFEAFSAFYFSLERLEKSKKLTWQNLKNECPLNCNPKLWEWICNTTLDALSQGLPLFEIKMAYLTLIIQYASERWFDLTDINIEQLPPQIKETIENSWLPISAT